MSIACPYTSDTEKRHTENYYCPQNGRCRRCGEKGEGNRILNCVWRFVLRFGRSA